MTNRRFIAVPREMTHDMIEGTYMLIETMPQGTPERLKRIVQEIWKQAIELAPPSRTGGLTPLQRRVHEIIADYIDDHGISPSYVEIGRQINRGGPDAFRIVQALKRRGAVTVNRHTKSNRRSIRLLVRPGEPLRPDISN